MELHEAEQLARQLMDEHGVTDDGWHFKWSNGKRHRRMSKDRLSRSYCQHCGVRSKEMLRVEDAR